MIKTLPSYQTSDLKLFDTIEEAEEHEETYKFRKLCNFTNCHIPVVWDESRTKFTIYTGNIANFILVNWDSIKEIVEE